MSDTDDTHRDNRDYWAHDARRTVDRAIAQHRKIENPSALDDSVLQRLESIAYNLRDIELMRESAMQRVGTLAKRGAKP